MHAPVCRSLSRFRRAGIESQPPIRTKSRFSVARRHCPLAALPACCRAPKHQRRASYPSQPRFQAKSIATRPSPAPSHAASSWQTPAHPLNPPTAVTRLFTPPKFLTTRHEHPSSEANRSIATSTTPRSLIRPSPAAITTARASPQIFHPSFDASAGCISPTPGGPGPFC